MCNGKLDDDVLQWMVLACVMVSYPTCVVTGDNRLAGDLVPSSWQCITIGSLTMCNSKLDDDVLQWMVLACVMVSYPTIIVIGDNKMVIACVLQ